jgi:hypothetical protein
MKKTTTQATVDSMADIPVDVTAMEIAPEIRRPTEMSLKLSI